MENLNEKKWYEEDGVIYFSVTSDGKTRNEWREHFKEKDYLSDYNPCSTHNLFFSKIKPTKGTTYKLAVLRGKLFSDRGRTTDEIIANANSRKLTTPSLEIFCLVRDKFTNGELQAMGLDCLVIMHNPIEVPDYGSLLAQVYDSIHGASILFDSSDGNVTFVGLFGKKSSRAWDKNHDFLFVASESLPK
jgi:hypothetical protein